MAEERDLENPDYVLGVLQQRSPTLCQLFEQQLAQLSEAELALLEPELSALAQVTDTTKERFMLDLERHAVKFELTTVSGDKIELLGLNYNEQQD